MGGKSASKSKKRKSEPQDNIKEEQTTEYTVSKIVDTRKIRGKTQYKVHWDGYNTDEETWENESQLNCDELIDKYLKDKIVSKGNDSEEDDDTDDVEDKIQEEQPEEKNQKKRGKSGAKKESYSKKQKPDPVNGQDEYEVEKIIEMHTLRNGKHEFLVRWHGFGKDGDTWEPEENLKGTDILTKFLDKVQKAKELPQKELRLHRAHTDRYTAMPQGEKRRQSKRNANRQRVKYYDAE
ncbi:chromobox protein homolog 1 [Halyomorpha halys]|uniref:chromobox protein homolog 1 n=1 Tax=Halyomorpha halys TaxID=286706 RepID=UPI0006D4E7BA|nr:heterochromatin protein 1 [Halyomorpha halys]